MSGLEPVRLKDGGFPDLTGDGKVTQADILKGRGVPGLANGGDPRFMSREGFFSMRDDPERLNVRDITDFIFDPSDPLDYAAAGMAATGVGVPAAIGMKGLNTARKVKRGLGALAGMVPTTMLAREGIEFAKGPIEYTKGILDLVTSAPEAAGSIREIAQALKEDPKGTASIIYETVSETAGYPVERAEGGIMQYANGTGDMGVLPASAKTPTGRKKKAVMTVMDMMDEIAEKLPTKPKKKTKKEKEPSAEDRKIIEDAAKQREAEVIAQQARLERARINRANEPTTPQPARPQAPVRTDAPEVGPPRPAPSQGANINKAADDAFEGSTGAERSIFQQMKDRPYAGIGLRNPGKTFIAGGVTAAVFPQGEDEPTVTDQPSISNDQVGDIGSPPPLLTDGITITGDGRVNTNPNVINNPSYDPGNDNSLAYYVREELKGKGFEVDEMGEFVTKPKFFDYIKALPAGYSEKVGNDSDFAKKMMAGFLNMMKPVEGYVPINPAVAFGEGYFGEETRQADMLSAEAKTLKFLKQNPRYQGLYKTIKAYEAGYNIGEIDAEKAQASFELLKRSLMSGGSYTPDQYEDLEVYYGATKITPREIVALLNQGVSLFGDPNFRLETKTPATP